MVLALSSTSDVHMGDRTDVSVPMSRREVSYGFVLKTFMMATSVSKTSSITRIVTIKTAVMPPPSAPSSSSFRIMYVYAPIMESNMM